MIFKDPWLLACIPVVIGLVMFLDRKGRRPSVLFPSQSLVKGVSPTLKMRLIRLPLILRIIVLSLVCVALAGPRSIEEETIHRTEGIDIVLTLDTSGSMAAEDFTIDKMRYNRLAVVKKVVDDFISQRTSDRLGLVAFAGLAYTVVPLTTDYGWLSSNLGRLDLGVIEPDGTAIGSAIASSVARLKDSDAKSRVIILLTDGKNTAGNLDPVETAHAAATFGIKIYTIAAGTNGYVPYPVRDIFGRKNYQKVLIEVDEPLLKEIADITGGKFYRATDTESLRNIYQEIDQLEKTEIEQYGYYEYTELFPAVLLIALALLIIELLLSQYVLMRIP